MGACAGDWTNVTLCNVNEADLVLEGVNQSGALSSERCNQWSVGRLAVGFDLTLEA